MIASLFLISSAKGALFLTRLFATEKLLFKVHLLRIFIRHKLSLLTKWKIFLVPLRFVFAFEKIKNKTLQNGFFLMEMLYIERVVQL